MSKCPFWSSKSQRVECYKECPMLIGENGEIRKGEQCIFHECSPSSGIDFRDVLKEEYNFMNLSLYEEEKRISIGY